jgi:hypothetical protein
MLYRALSFFLSFLMIKEMIKEMIRGDFLNRLKFNQVKLLR